MSPSLPACGSSRSTRAATSPWVRPKCSSTASRARTTTTACTRSCSDRTAASTSTRATPASNGARVKNGKGDFVIDSTGSEVGARGHQVARRSARQRRSSLHERHGLPLQSRRHGLRGARPQLPQQLRGLRRLLRHGVAVRQRRRRQPGRPHQLRHGRRQFRLRRLARIRAGAATRAHIPASRARKRTCTSATPASCPTCSVPARIAEPASSPTEGDLPGLTGEADSLRRGPERRPHLWRPIATGSRLQVRVGRSRRITPTLRFRRDVCVGLQLKIYIADWGPTRASAATRRATRTHGDDQRCASARIAPPASSLRRRSWTCRSVRRGSDSTPARRTQRAASRAIEARGGQGFWKRQALESHEGVDQRPPPRPRVRGCCYGADGVKVIKPSRIRASTSASRRCARRARSQARHDRDQKSLPDPSPVIAASFVSRELQSTGKCMDVLRVALGDRSSPRTPMKVAANKDWWATQESGTGRRPCPKCHLEAFVACTNREKGSSGSLAEERQE